MKQNVYIYKQNICYRDDVFSSNALKCVSMNNGECKVRPDKY